MHLSIFVLFVFSSTFFLGCFSESHRHSQVSINGKKGFGSTALFPVNGNVYPDGYFYTTVSIGEPPQPYHLDIDTGSDLSWVQCDAPCVNCIKSPHRPYKPRDNALACKEPLCAFLQHPPNFPCHNPADQCDYEIEYADHGSSIGVLVKDNFPLQFLNSSIARPSLAFGCGYDQEISGSSHPPFVDGVLGLANGKSSILSQLHDLKITKNVFGHCFSSQGGGYLFFGDELVPKGTVWVPMTENHIGTYYSIGPAELSFGGQNIVKGGLSVVFDSGSTYTYLNKQAYEAALSMIKKNIDPKQLKNAPEDKTLPICWKGARPFKSVSDVNKFFKPLALRFQNAKNAVMEMPLEAYLVISKNGNVCLGILNGTEAELENLNVLGDVSLLGKMVIYDNEKRQIGWSTANCDRLPKF